MDTLEWQNLHCRRQCWVHLYLYKPKQVQVIHSQITFITRAHLLQLPGGTTLHSQANKLTNMDLRGERKNSASINGKVENLIAEVNFRPLQQPNLHLSGGCWRPESAAKNAKSALKIKAPSYQRKLPDWITNQEKHKVWFQTRGQAACTAVPSSRSPAEAPGLRVSRSHQPKLLQRHHLHHYAYKWRYDYFFQIQKHHISFTGRS